MDRAISPRGQESGIWLPNGQDEAPRTWLMSIIRASGETCLGGLIFEEKLKEYNTPPESNTNSRVKS